MTEAVTDLADWLQAKADLLRSLAEHPPTEHAWDFLFADAEHYAEAARLVRLSTGTGATTGDGHVLIEYAEQLVRWFGIYPNQGAGDRARCLQIAEALREWQQLRRETAAGCEHKYDAVLDDVGRHYVGRCRKCGALANLSPSPAAEGVDVEALIADWEARKRFTNPDFLRQIPDVVMAGDAMATALAADRARRDGMGGLAVAEAKLQAISDWLGEHQPDVFARGLWGAIDAAIERIGRDGE